MYLYVLSHISADTYIDIHVDLHSLHVVMYVDIHVEYNVSMTHTCAYMNHTY